MAGTVRLGATGLVVDGAATPPRLLGSLDAVLRGIGQVMLQENAYTGVLIAIGVFYNSLVMGIALLVGTIASTMTAVALGANRTHVRAGLYGFNGGLVGIALVYFFTPSAVVWGYVIVGAACSTVVMAALMRFMETWKAPALTAPFVVVTLLFLVAGAQLSRLLPAGTLPTAALPTPASAGAVVSGATVIEGLFTGVAQVFLQGNVITGVFFVAGLLVSSRAAGIVALLGSLVGLLVAWGMGAAEPAMRAGLHGFNPVLTAIALASGYFVWSAASTAYALLAMIVTAIVSAALTAALQPLGMPALTAPFVLVVWAFVLASPLFLRLRVRSAAG